MDFHLAFIERQLLSIYIMYWTQHPVELLDINVGNDAVEIANT